MLRASAGVSCEALVVFMVVYFSIRPPQLGGQGQSPSRPEEFQRRSGHSRCSDERTNARAHETYAGPDCHLGANMVFFALRHENGEDENSDACQDGYSRLGIRHGHADRSHGPFGLVARTY